jgi:hypothetical protein
VTEYAEEDMLKQKKPAVTERIKTAPVLEKNRTEPVKNCGAEKKYLCFIFTDIFFDSHARPSVFEHRFSRDFIRVVLICLLTEVVYTCWRW